MAIALGALSAGCTTTAETTGSTTAAVAPPRGATVAFESLDGLPTYQFQKLVQLLQQEAETRQLAVVSRLVPSQYRIRGYATALIQKKRTTIAWVWDVYDNTQQRSLRISGEEQATNPRRGWAAVDDQTMQRIARDGMAQLAGFLTSPPEPAPPLVTPPPTPGPAVAGIEGMTTQASLVSDR
jgi:hypothetical protein